MGVRETGVSWIMAHRQEQEEKVSLCFVIPGAGGGGSLSSRSARTITIIFVNLSV